jgi:hypothetical protein
MKTTEGLGDFVVIHALDPEDALAIVPMRAAARTQKGAPWRIESRKFYDALMEGVSPRDDTRFESATVGGVPGLWVRPASSRSDEAILHVHGGWFNAGSATPYRHLSRRRGRAGAAGQRVPSARPDAHAGQRAGSVLRRWRARPAWPGTKLQMIAVDDIGWFGARAFTDATALNRREIDLAGDVRTMPEAAETLTEALSLEGHRREPARGSWDVAQWAGNGKTQVTRQDCASCGRVGLPVDTTCRASHHAPSARTYASPTVRLRNLTSISAASSASEVTASSPHNLSTCGFVRDRPGISTYSARTSMSQSSTCVSALDMVHPRCCS